MISARGIPSHSVTMSHSTNHASPKASSSSSAGPIIHGLHDEQDMRKMGASNRIPPSTYTMTPIGSPAPIGPPLSTGYHSKDSIPELASPKTLSTGNIAHRSGTLPVSSTTLYPHRPIFPTLSNRSNAFARTTSQACEPNIITAIPSVLLATASVSIGHLGRDMIIGIGTAFRGNPLSPPIVDAEHPPYHIKVIPPLSSHLGIFVAYHVSSAGFKASSSLSHIDGRPGFVTHIYKFFSHRRNSDNSHNRFTVQKVLSPGHHISSRLSDAGRIAYLGPYGVSRVVETLSQSATKQLQTGSVHHHAHITSSGTVSFLLGAICGRKSLSDDETLSSASVSVPTSLHLLTRRPAMR
jgi:NADH-quinone oxidoreductase subunit L